jgi:8-oxo-dGTP pyrophosphatase MutT (NUDIX family)
MAENFVDKIAFVLVQDRKVLVALSKGSDAWYLPGGHREPGETDTETLVREVREELSVGIVLATVAYYGTFEAQAHGAPAGKIARITCYTARYEGKLEASSEIAKIGFLSYDQKGKTSAPTQMLLDDLKGKNMID